VAASYFDVDGTLVSTNLVQPTLYYLANLGTPLKSLKSLGGALLKAPAMALAEARDRRLFNELLYSAYAGVSEDRLEVLSREVYEKVLRPALYPFAQGLVDQAKRAGHDVVLLSGALEVVIRHLAEELGADHVIANRLELKGRVATGKILRPVVAGPTKARLLAEHARTHGHDLADCYAYSDSYSDVPMLSVVGHPAAVNPDKKLALLAEAYSWPTMQLSSSGEGPRPRRGAPPASGQRSS
jgi:HAD superfamily hydrolase (TIGR01490 family)